MTVSNTPAPRSAFHVIHPRLTDLGERDSQERHRLPFHLACLGLLLYLLISDNLLVSLGIPYNIPSGSFLYKLHPGTYLITLGFLLLLLQGHPREHWMRLFANASAPLLFAGVVLSIVVYSGIRFGPSGNAYLIDTLLTPAFLGVVLLQVSLESRRFVFRMALVLLAFNALLGIGEALSERHLTPFMIGDEPVIEEYFRATALGGHPLKNSLRTATILMVCLMLPLWLRLFLIPLLLIALLAFGSRTALTMSLLLLGGWGAYAYSRDIVMRTLDPRLVFGLIFISLILMASIGWVIVGTTIGDRIFQNFFWDESAHSRILVFHALGYLSLQDWLWGMGSAGRVSILNYLTAFANIYGYENFWVLFIMEIGLAWFIPLCLTLLWMIAGLIRGAPLVLKLAAVMFLILASSNNSLATKSQELAILLAILIGGAAEAGLMTRSTSIAPSRRYTRMSSLQRVKSHPGQVESGERPANQSFP